MLAFGFCIAYFKPTLTLEVWYNFMSRILNTCFNRKISFCIEHLNDLNFIFVYPLPKLVNSIQRLLYTSYVIMKEQERKQRGEMGKVL